MYFVTFYMVVATTDVICESGRHITSIATIDIKRHV